MVASHKDRFPTVRLYEYSVPGPYNITLATLGLMAHDGRQEAKANSGTASEQPPPCRVCRARTERWRP